MKAFKIRASEAGKIMGSPKKNELPVGAQTYLKNGIYLRSTAAVCRYARTRWTKAYAAKSNL